MTSDFMSSEHSAPVVGAGEARASAEEAPRRHLLRSTHVAVIIGVVGLVLTAGVTWTAWTLNRNNNHQLLVDQTKQAAAVINSTILAIEGPVSTALHIAEVGGVSGQQFEQFMAAYTGPDSLFVSASLWQVSGTSFLPLGTVGSPPELVPTSAAAQALMARTMHSTTFDVISLHSGTEQRIGYALGDPSHPKYVVYVERTIPANRQAQVEGNSAFSSLDFATYLGPTEQLADLTTTDVPLRDLPLKGDTTRQAIPFGDTTLTLVAAPKGQLAGAVGGEVPWVFLVGGTLLTLAVAMAVEQLVRRRRDAERGALTIADLYGQLDTLYGEQRTIAEALQRAILPPFLPAIPHLEAASRYVAGADGVDVGGDWYSLIAVDDTHFGFVVGDVSGRGISAATVMARLRYTIRAYLLEGHPPHVVLDMCSRQLDVKTDGHFTTVVVGIGNVETGELTLANAGHLNPLVVSASGSHYLSMEAGVPLGVDQTTYSSLSVTLPPGAVFLAFTDGLVERRGEHIDVGLERLAELARTPAANLDDLLSSVVSEMAHNGSEDDIAVLAFTWRDAST
jgi:serine phosphatase RsbU (regulator of sigma subunit)